MEWFTDWWNAVQLWLGEVFAAFLGLLDFGPLVISLASWVAGLLPPPIDWEPYAGPIDQVMSGFVPIYQYADYWVNMPVVSGAALVVLGVEVTLGLPRLWKFIVSLRFW